MKKLLACLLSTLFFIGFAGCSSEQEVLTFRVMTHNLRFSYNAADTDYGDRRADERMSDELDFLQSADCDIIFLNEAAKYQDEILQEKAESLGYGFVRESDFADGVANYNGTKADLYSARFCNYILFRKDKFTLQDTSSFSLSDNPSDPHAPFSRMSYNALWNEEGRPRSAVWALLSHKSTKTKILAVCAHAQWITNDNGVNWNQEGLKVLAEQIEIAQKYYPESKVIFGGDFNGENISAFDPAMYKGVNTDASLKTFENSAIDHIFYSASGKHTAACLAGTLALSDHFALQATIEFT